MARKEEGEAMLCEGNASSFEMLLNPKEGGENNLRRSCNMYVGGIDLLVASDWMREIWRTSPRCCRGGRRGRPAVGD